MKSSTKVMVAGGGIGGLAAAIALRRAAFDVTVDPPTELDANLDRELDHSSVTTLRRWIEDAGRVSPRRDTEPWR